MRTRKVHSIELNAHFTSFFFFEEKKKAFRHYLILIPIRTTLRQWLWYTGSTGQRLWCIHFIRFKQTEYGPITNFPKMWSIENDSNSQRKRKHQKWNTQKHQVNKASNILCTYANVCVYVLNMCDNDYWSNFGARKNGIFWSCWILQCAVRRAFVSFVLWKVNLLLVHNHSVWFRFSSVRDISLFVLSSRLEYCPLPITITKMKCPYRM